MDECLSLKPDVIAVTTTPAAHLLKKATQTTPIVMVALGDPLGTGLVDNLSKPSANITGMSLMVPELAVKRLELLRELVRASRASLSCHISQTPSHPSR